MTFMEALCRHCGKPIAETWAGWGHLTNPTFAHHRATPTARRGDVTGSPARESVASLGRRIQRVPGRQRSAHDGVDPAAS